MPYSRNMSTCVGNRLRSLRETAELSQVQVALESGVNQGVLSLIETNKRQANEDTEKAIEAAIIRLMSRRVATYSTVLAGQFAMAR